MTTSAVTIEPAIVFPVLRNDRSTQRGSRSGDRCSTCRISVVGCFLPMLIAWSLLGGCSRSRESAFSQKPVPDLAVTTLEVADMETVASLMQFQGTIRMGCDLAIKNPLPTLLIRLVDSVRDQYQSRARDLEALVRLKNAPMPENLGKQNSMLIDELSQTNPLAWDPAVVTFLRAVHTRAMRLMRDMADNAKDPDVREFAARQLPGVVSTLQQLDHLAQVDR